MKTAATDFRLNKTGESYSFDFKVSESPDAVSVEVNCVEGFSKPDGVTPEAFPWGQLFALESAPGMTEFYLSPEGVDFVVKVGPMPSNVDQQDFEIDWFNLQWAFG